jgi:hypothetical protein
MTYGKSAGWVAFIAVLALVNSGREAAVEPSSGQGRGVMADAQRVTPAEPRQQKPTLVDSRGTTVRSGAARAQGTAALPRT